MQKRRVADVLGPESKLADLGVEPNAVWVRVAPWWLRLVWREPFEAITAPWGIYLRRLPTDYEPDALGRLLLHELAHMAQWRRMGVRRFLVAYLGGYLKQRRAGLNPLEAYATIPLEQEARAAEAGLNPF